MLFFVKKALQDAKPQGLFPGGAHPDKRVVVN
jgi:hypothetical protein